MRQAIWDWCSLVGFWWGSSLGLQIAAFSSKSHMVGRWWAGELSDHFQRGQSPFIRTLPCDPLTYQRLCFLILTLWGQDLETWMWGRHIHPVLCLNTTGSEVRGLNPRVFKLHAHRARSSAARESRIQKQRRISWKSTGKTKHHKLSLFPKIEGKY